MMTRIYYTKPSITDREVRYATDAARHGWGQRCYEYIDRFETLFREHLGTQFSVATSSCTGALHMGLAALGLGPGDEVILADTNWIASAAPITYLGAKPVFVDILPDTWCLDPDRVQAAVTSRTKAILAVHLYGNLCQMDRLLELGNRHGIPVIEDAAEAIGSSWQGNPAGSMGLFGAFSFHGSKTVTTGEGGMFTTNDASLARKVLTLSYHGRAPGETKQFWPERIGFKYRMSNVDAAIGCAQLERLEELVKRKREIFAYYRQALGQVKGVSMNPEEAGTVNGYWMPTLVFDRHTGVSGEMLLRLLRDRNIDARSVFHPLSSLPMFSPCPGNTESYNLSEKAINIPSYHDIREEDMNRVIKAVKAARGETSRESPGETD